MKTALLSVWDKTGIVELAQELVAAGWQLVASGGTARTLRGAGLVVIKVSDLTGSPEILGGRVKTLHPAIYGGILARETEADATDLARFNARPIDLVACNLYPFQETIANPDATLEDAIEKIDIGGVTLIRAAAKNFKRVTVLTDVSDYAQVIETLRTRDGTSLDLRWRLAKKAFAHTRDYDTVIAAYLSGDDLLNFQLHPIQSLRYGENPHQQATYYRAQPSGGPLGGTLLQGKPLSYNNLLDLDGAWRAALKFEDPAAVIVKHVSPCGIAVASSVEKAIVPAIASDPVSAFGSVIAANRPINADFVRGLGDLFVECLAAPAFSTEARSLLADKKKLRLLKISLDAPTAGHELRSVVGGFLRQSVDAGDPADAPPWRVVTQRKPEAEEMKILDFAWRAVQPVKSNAVLLAKGDAETLFTVGIGGGQPNRLDCVRMAGHRAGDRADGSVLASDAFFSFPDGLRVAAELGVTAVVQPGGSVRDEQVIATADELGLTMVFTGVRHFRH